MMRRELIHNAEAYRDKLIKMAKSTLESQGGQCTEENIKSMAGMIHISIVSKIQKLVVESFHQGALSGSRPTGFTKPNPQSGESTAS